MLRDTLRPGVAYNFSQITDTRTARFSVQASGGPHEIPINLAPSVLLLIHLLSEKILCCPYPLYLGEGIFLWRHHDSIA